MRKSRGSFNFLSEAIFLIFAQVTAKLYMPSMEYFLFLQLIVAILAVERSHGYLDLNSSDQLKT